MRRVRAGQVIVGQQPRQRDDRCERRPVAVAIERGRDRHVGAAHGRVTLASDGDHLQVGLVLRDLLSREADGVGVERAGQAAVGGQQHDQARAARSLREQRVLGLAEHGREVGQDLVDLVGVRARLERRVLGALELRGSHELHRPGDLLDVAHGRDAASDLALAGHLRLGPLRAQSAQAEKVCLNDSVASRRPSTISSVSPPLSPRLLSRSACSASRNR